MTTAFQGGGAFQSDAFQIEGGVTSGAITGSLSYTNNNDTFAGLANLGASQVTGGWPTYYPRRKRVPAPETVDSTQETVEAIAVRLSNERKAFAARLALAKEERRSRAITEQLRAIYAEQDVLALGLEIAKTQQAENDDEEALMLILAS